MPDDTKDPMEPGAQGHDPKPWYDEARNKVKTPAQLAEFVTKLLALQHDYGSIVDATIAASLAAFWTVNADEKSGGITGFQASWVASMYYAKLMGIESPFRVVKYEDMLRPGGERTFARTIDLRTFQWLQKKAAEKLGLAEDLLDADIRAHLQSIVDGAVPFGFKISDRE